MGALRKSGRYGPARRNWHGRRWCASARRCEQAVDGRRRGALRRGSVDDADTCRRAADRAHGEVGLAVVVRRAGGDRKGHLRPGRSAVGGSEQHRRAAVVHHADLFGNRVGSPCPALRHCGTGDAEDLRVRYVTRQSMRRPGHAAVGGGCDRAERRLVAPRASEARSARVRRLVLVLFRGSGGLTGRDRTHRGAWHRPRRRLRRRRNVSRPASLFISMPLSREQQAPGARKPLVACCPGLSSRSQK